LEGSFVLYLSISSWIFVGWFSESLEKAISYYLPQAWIGQKGMF
jgi:hypothetical protein